MQMIIWRDRPLANNHPERPTSCKRSSGRAGLLQMIIRRGRPLANNHLEWLASCKSTSRVAGLLQMSFPRDRPLANDHPSPLSPWSPLAGYRFNLADLSRTIGSCLVWLAGEAFSETLEFDQRKNLPIHCGDQRDC